MNMIKKVVLVLTFFVSVYLYMELVGYIIEEMRKKIKGKWENFFKKIKGRVM